MITLVKTIYNNAKSRLRVDCEYSDVFSVTADVHLGLVFSPLMFFECFGGTV